MRSLIEAAIDVVGGQTVLARALGVSPQLVWQWKSGNRPISAKQAIAIDRATNGVVTKEALRPDIFSEPTKGRAA